MNLAYIDAKAEANKVRQLAVFCLLHGGHLFRNWSGEKLFKYLAFHWFSGQLLWTRDVDGEIDGVFIAWPDFASEILRREQSGDFHFNWRAGIGAGGDALMIADVIIDAHGRDARETRDRLLQAASARWPDWKMRRLFTHRRCRLTELSHATVARLFHEQPVST